MKILFPLIALIFISTNSNSQRKSENLLVIVGKLVSWNSGSRVPKDYAKLTYKIVEKTYGNYLKDTIDIFASIKPDSLKFTRYKTVLLFLHRDGNEVYKFAMPCYEVYQTVDGEWASGAVWWEYEGYPTKIKPKGLIFREPVYIDTKGMTKELIDHYYPAKYYQRKNGKVTPIWGNSSKELFELHKTGLLHDYGFF